ncbi:MAG: hypothetical protein RQ760_03695 [Sedimentisphaerales bacterium]|nr:hypothetical protein [Sedimentisphaerales bacterium]
MRKQWYLEQFDGVNLDMRWPKQYLTKALVRLYLSNGNDPEALQYITDALTGPGDFFKFPPLTHALYMFGDRFSSDQMAKIKNTVTSKPWSSGSKSVEDHATENQAAMNVVSMYLLAQYFPDATWDSPKFPTSQQRMAEAKSRLLKRGRYFYELSQAEFLSPTYYFLNASPFLLLADYADDPEVRNAAEALLLFHFSQRALNNLDGHPIASVNRRYIINKYDEPDGKVEPGVIWTWLLWGQCKVYRTNVLKNDGMWAVHYALSDWRVPDVLNRIAQGANAPYEIKGLIGPFGRWNISDWIREPQKALRYGWRGQEYAVGGTVAEYFQPDGYYTDRHDFDISWKSSHPYHQLEAMHPYWASDEGEDRWNETHSPFQQFGIHENTAITLFNIPDSDPFAGRGSSRWTVDRDRHYDNLIKLGQVRFPATVNEVVQSGDAYFFREGNVYVAIRVLKPGHTMVQISGLTAEKGRPDDVWNVIKSREAKTGFVIEVGTTQEHESFSAFQNAILNNPLSVDWDQLEVNYTNTRDDDLRFKYATNMSEVEEMWDQTAIWFRPKLWINGQLRRYDNWPVADSPVVSLQNSVLRISQGGDSFTVEWSGQLPKIRKNQ